MGKTGVKASLLAWILGAAAGAQPPGLPAPPAGQEEPAVAITETEVIFATDENKGVTLLEFIKIAQQVTGKKFIPPDNLTTAAGGPPGMPALPGAQPRIIVYGRMRIRKENFFAFFQMILRIKDYALVRRGSDDIETYEIILLNSPRRNEIKNSLLFVEPEKLVEFANDEGTVVLTTVNFRYVDPRQASATLRPLFTDAQGFSQMQSIGDSQAMLLMGFAPWVWTMYRMIQLVDVPAVTDQPVVRIVRLQHASADELEPILSDLVNTRTGIIRGGRQGQTPQQPRQQGQEFEPRVIPEPRTNALIMTASKEDMPLIEEMVVRLDTPMEDVEGDYHVIQLTNVLAKDLEQTLRQFLTEAQQAEQQARQGQGRTRAVREVRTIMRADEKSNSLIVSATKSRYAEILKLVERLDVRRPQVLIEAALVEVDVNSTFDFGTELGLVDVASEGTKFTRPFGFTNFGLSQFQDTDTNGIPDTRLPNFDNPPKGLLGGIISGGDFSIPLLLNLNQTDSLANVLSIPSVLVNDNETATVESKREVPTQTSNQGTATTSTGFQGYQPAGISLKISPSISESNFLKLNVELEVSRFLGTATNAALPPDKITRKIITQVTMPSGHTLVLGGVLQDDTSNSNTGIPFLKDIPLLGFLFGSHSRSGEKLNLYFFVTPYILDELDFSDLKDITYQRKLEAQQYIGRERIQIVDRRWTGGSAPRIDDTGVTAEDLEQLGGFELPSYAPPRGGERPAGAGETSGPPPSPTGSAPGREGRAP